MTATIHKLHVPNTNLIVINHRWYSGVDIVGIVLTEDSITKKTKAYIGVGRKGTDENQDVIHIAKWGTKIPKSLAEAEFGNLPDYAW